MRKQTAKETLVKVFDELVEHTVIRDALKQQIEVSLHSDGILWVSLSDDIVKVFRFTDLIDSAISLYPEDEDYGLTKLANVFIRHAKRLRKIAKVRDAEETARAKGVRGRVVEYCEACRAKHEWPKSPEVRSGSRCEECGRFFFCYVAHSSKLKGWSAPLEQVAAAAAAPDLAAQDQQQADDQAGR